MFGRATITLGIGPNSSFVYTTVTPPVVAAYGTAAALVLPVRRSAAVQYWFVRTLYTFFDNNINKYGERWWQWVDKKLKACTAAVGYSRWHEQLFC